MRSMRVVFASPVSASPCSPPSLARRMCPSTSSARSPVLSRPRRPRRSATSTRGSRSCSPSTTTRRSARSGRRPSSTRAARWRTGASRSPTARTSTTRAAARPSAEGRRGRRSARRARPRRRARRPVERALDRRRSPSATPTRRPRTASRSTSAYADAMREVWAAYPDDADIGALFAEALMDLRPWDLWTARRQAAAGDRRDRRDARGGAEARRPTTRSRNHLYIHAVEASPHPGAGPTRAADRAARPGCPALGHLVHMPSHIDVRRGRWQRGDRGQRARRSRPTRATASAPEQGFYRLYMAHNHHMLAFAAMMRGAERRGARSRSATMVAGDAAELRRARTPRSSTASWPCRSRC